MPDFRISIADAHAHRFGVELDVEVPQGDGDELIVSLPVWIPGSYMVREFARHLLRLEAREARADAAVLPVEVVDKTTWRVRLGARTTSRKSSRRVTLSYEVYGFDPSVRACYLDQERAFFNGTSLLLRVHGLEGEPHRLRFGPLPRGWDIATAMPKQGTRFVAADYDEAVDHPFELGAFWRGSFDARGIEHEFVVTGAWPSFDGERLLADSKAICETQIDFWHGGGAAPKRAGRRARRADAPFDRYVFILHALDDGYGGLEHRASTALIASRKDLPRKAASKAGASKAAVGTAADKPGERAASDGYVTLLGLISHEYFHTWNVKRLKPAELARVDYTRENHTALLWFFEGFTSYYDDLILRRAGLIGDNRYLGLVAKQINMLRAAPGRKVQSVAQASFDAWTKYYRADENTPNLTVSYYVKGALVALAFDLTLRAEGLGAGGSLDDVMRSLWHDSGAASGCIDLESGVIDEAAIAKALATVAGRSLERELRAWVHGTDDPPWAELFDKVGVSTSHESPPTLAALLGLRVAEAGGSVIVKQVLDGGVAQRAGVAAGDEILAFDGWRLRKLDDACSWWTAPRPFELTVVRDQRLRTLRVGPRAIEVAASAARPVVLTPALRSDAALERRRQRWLQGG